MTSINDSELPSSAQDDDSDEGEQDSIKQEEEEEEEDEPPKPNVASILARLQSSGALLKKPKQEYRCFPCDKDFSSWQDLEKHIITHVSLPSVVLDKLPSDEEDLPPSGDENWSDEDEDQSPPKTNLAQTPQKIDISQILKKTGLSLKTTPSENNSSSSDSALNKLSGLGFTIKKNVTPIKKEKPDNEENDNVMQKLGKLGGIKLKLKSDGNNTNSFKVVNGLKDFKASDDDDDDGSANEDDKDDQDFDDDIDKSGENDGSEGEQDSDDQQNNRKQPGNSDLEALKRKIPNLHAAIQGKVITPKKEPPSTPLKVTPIKIHKDDILQVKPLNSRPIVKQTPKRGVNVPTASKETQQLNETSTSRRPSQTSTPDTPRRPSQTPTPDTPKRPSQTPTPDSSRRLSQTNTPERPQLNDRIENVVVKQEPQAPSGDTQNNIPLFSGPIKSERSTPPLSERTTPILAHVKSEPEVSSTSSTQPLFSYQNSHSVNTSTATTSHTSTLLPVTKTEDTGVTVIEINGDSNDEDDDCCVVSTTPAPDVKPIVPKVEKPTTLPPPYSATPSYTTSQTLYKTAPASSSRSSSALSTEKQHSFNWNAPDSKPLDFLEKSADDIFESLLSSSTKKENISLSEASEYISLDTLGPQHSCDVCNTRFTDVSLLEEHIRMTGHSKSIVARTSSLMPYDSSSSNLLLSSLLPVKQIAEQVGKLSTTSNSGPGFTHQQNVMINIQAYPGAGGVIVPPQYNSYNSGQATHGNYPQTSGNVYGTQPMTMPNQYPGTNFMPPGYGQYQSPMSKPGYPGTMPPNSFSMASPQYSSASPLQSMQQAVYGQSMMNPSGSMGPPGSSPGHSYASTSSPGGLKQQTSSGIKIQNVQTFPPGQMPGQTQPGQQMSSGPELGIGQMAPPSQPGQVQGGTPIRMATGANISGIRPRMPSVRGQRPTIRPGIQVHGQVRGAKIGGPRMPLKRPGAMAGGPGQKRRPDMLLPGKHDNEDCQVMALQKQREGLPLIQSVQGAKDKLNLGSQISITKKPVNKEANAMANVLASRGISVKQKQKSRSPTPERPLPHIPNLGAGMSIKHTSRSSKFSIPEAKVGGGMYSCKICKKMFMNHNSLQVHISNAHPQSKIPVFKCDECPASYPKSLQLQHHKRVFHNVTGPNRELGLPVVDLSQEDNLNRLSSLGIYSFIPLANREQANGCFGIPVISVHNMQNGLTSGLQALGADGLLSLGPLKPLPNS